MLNRNIPVTLKSLVAVLLLTTADIACHAATASSGPIGAARIKRLAGQALFRQDNWPRWLPARGQEMIRHGASIKTLDSNGSLVELGLTEGGTLVLGPSTCVRLRNEGDLQLIEGEIAIDPPPGDQVMVSGPSTSGHNSIRCARRMVLSSRGGQFRATKDSPEWLEVYLTAKAIPPTGELRLELDQGIHRFPIGYQKVTVHIRNQLARTVVEQAFLNDTWQEQESVFRVWLPQGASLATLGWWADGKFFDAPAATDRNVPSKGHGGLLPIPGKRSTAIIENLIGTKVPAAKPRSFTRVIFSYDQLLALHDGSYSYIYPLASGASARTPIRDLDIQISLSSSIPLAKVSCLTHAGRLKKQDDEVQFDYVTRNEMPQKDLELVVTPEPDRPTAVVETCMENGRGYFMMLAEAPGTTGQLRPNTIDGLTLLILADTSASMSDQEMARQFAFISTLLNCLGKQDRYALAALDVEPVWFTQDGFVAADGEPTREAVLERLASRRSLGWTDLPRGLEAAMKIIESDLPERVEPGPVTSERMTPDIEAVRQPETDWAKLEAALWADDEVWGRVDGVEPTTERDSVPAMTLGERLSRFFQTGSDEDGGPVAEPTDQPEESAAKPDIGMSVIPPPPRREYHIVYIGDGFHTAPTATIPEAERAVRDLLGTTGGHKWKNVKAVFHAIDTADGNLQKPARAILPTRHGGFTLRKGAGVEEAAGQFLTGVTLSTALPTAPRCNDVAVNGLTPSCLKPTVSGEQLVFFGSFDPDTLTRRSQISFDWLTDGARTTATAAFGKPSEVDQDSPVKRQWDLRMSKKPEQAKVFAANQDSSQVAPGSPPTAADEEPMIYQETVLQGSGPEDADKEVSDTHLALSDLLACLDPILFGVPPVAAAQIVLPAGHEEPEGWSQEAVRMVRSFSRNRQQALSTGALGLAYEGRKLKVDRDGEDLYRWEAVLEAERWYGRRTGPAVGSLAMYADGEFLDVINQATGIAHRQNSQLVTPQIPLPDGGFAAWLGLPRHLNCTVRTGALTRKTLVFRNADGSKAVEADVDLVRKCILAKRVYSKESVVSETIFTDFFQAAGAWWFGVAEEKNSDGVATHMHRLALITVDKETAETVWLDRQEMLSQCLVLTPSQMTTEQVSGPAVEIGQEGSGARIRMLLRALRAGHSREAQRYWDGIATERAGARGTAWVSMLMAGLGGDPSTIHERVAGVTEYLSPGQLPPAGHTFTGLPVGAKTFEPGDLAYVAKTIIELCVAVPGVPLPPELEHVMLQLPRELRGEQRWVTLQVAKLREKGNDQEALLILEQLTRRMPWDAYVYAQYAEALILASRESDAVAWLDRGLATPEQFWDFGSREVIRKAYIRLANQHLGADRALPIIAGSLAEGRADHEEHLRLLTTLAKAGRDDEAYAIAGQWLNTRELAMDGSEQRVAKLGAALEMLLEEAPWFSLHKQDDMWLGLLAAIIEHALDQKQLIPFVDRIMAVSAVVKSPQVRAALDRIAERVIGDAFTTDSETLRKAVEWLNMPSLPIGRRVAEALEQAWESSRSDRSRRAELGRLTLTAWEAVDTASAIRFAGVLLRSSDLVSREDLDTYLDLLSKNSWSADLEQDALGLVEAVASGGGSALAVADALETIVNWSLAGREEAAFSDACRRLEGVPVRIRVARRAAYRKEAGAQAQWEMTNVLQQMHMQDTYRLAPWVQAYKLALLAGLRRSPGFGMLTGDVRASVPAIGTISAEVFDFLGPRAPDSFNEESERRLLETYLAVAEDCALVNPETCAAPLMGYLLSSLEGAVRGHSAGDWRRITVDEWRGKIDRFLSKLGRDKGREKALLDWIAADGMDSVDGRWQQRLGQLYAETGRIQKAIAATVHLLDAGKLDNEGCQRLALWLTRTGDLAGAARALEPVWTMASLQGLRTVAAGHVAAVESGALDTAGTFTRLRFTTLLPHLLRRTRCDRQLVHEVLRLYCLDQDPAVLQAVIDGAIGLAPEARPVAMTNFALALRDSMSTPNGNTPAVAPLAPQAAAQMLLMCKGGNPTDSNSGRDANAKLLAAVLECHLARLPGAGSQQASAAAAALRQTFRGLEFDNTTPVETAELIHSLGPFPEGAALDEQVRQLRHVYRRTQVGEPARIRTAMLYCDTLWNSGRPQVAAEILARELVANRGSQGPRLPLIREAFSQAIGYLTELKQYAQAEELLKAEIATVGPINDASQLYSMLYSLYGKAMSGGAPNGDPELGLKLYRRALQELASSLFRPGNADFAGTCSAASEFFQGAALLEPDSLREDIRLFSVETAPKYLETALPKPSQYAAGVRTVSTEIVRRHLGPREALAFAVAALQTLPSQLRTDRTLFTGVIRADWIIQAGDLGRVEKPLTEILCDALARNLLGDEAPIPEACRLQGTEEAGRRVPGNPGRGAEEQLFWADKAPVFQTIAEQCHARRRKWVGFNVLPAEYVFTGLGLSERGLELYLDLEQEGLLTGSDRLRLAQRLVEHGKRADAERILDNISSAGAVDPDQLPELLALWREFTAPENIEGALRTIEESIEDGKPDLGVRYTRLAAACRHAGLLPQAERYSRLAVAACGAQTAATKRGMHAARRELMLSLVAQNKAGEAVELMSELLSRAANDNGTTGLTATAIVDLAPDITRFATALSAHYNASGNVCLPIHRVLAARLREDGHWEAAREQCEMILAVDPDDETAIAELIRILEHQGSTQRALELAYELTRSRPFRKAYHADLASRLADGGNDEEAPRALTSFVDIMPDDPHSYQWLAEEAEKHSRWPLAALQWRHLAALNSDDPEWLLRLARAQYAGNNPNGAAATVRKILDRQWNRKYGDVHARALKLLGQ